MIEYERFMFEGLEIQIYRFSPFLSSTLKLPREGEKEEGFAFVYT